MVFLINYYASNQLGNNYFMGVVFHLLLPIAQRGGREAATHLWCMVYTISIKIFCKKYGSVWRALSSYYDSYYRANSSSAVSLRSIRAYSRQYRYAMPMHTKVPTRDSIATLCLCIRKDNIASLTCLMTYSHELQLYMYL